LQTERIGDLNANQHHDLFAKPILVNESIPMLDAAFQTKNRDRSQSQIRNHNGRPAGILSIHLKDRLLPMVKGAS